MDEPTIKKELNEIIKDVNSPDSVASRIIANINQVYEKNGEKHKMISGKDKKEKFVQYLVKNMQTFINESLRLPGAGPRTDMPQTDSPKDYPKSLNLSTNSIINDKDKRKLEVRELIRNSQIDLGKDELDKDPNIYTKLVKIRDDKVKNH